VYYTGYVSQPSSVSSRRGGNAAMPNQVPSIVVSAGGGRFGYELLEAVLKASPLLEPHLPHQIQMFTGPFMPADQVADLQAQAPHSAVVRCFTPNLVELMEQADLSISLGGYNTTMNILKTGVRALVFPEAAVEQAGEQTIRAEKLAEKGVLQVLYRSDLQPERLAEKIRMALHQPSSPYQVDLQGAARSLWCLRELLEQSAIAA
jgi:predicted glycosyltransferase